MSGCGLDFGTSNSGVALGRGRMASRARRSRPPPALPSAIFFRRRGFARELRPRRDCGTTSTARRGAHTLAQRACSAAGSCTSAPAVATGALAFTGHPHAVPGACCASAREDASAALLVLLGVRCASSTTMRRATPDANHTRGACARDGIRDVAFQLEPIAAAFDYERTVPGEESVLVVDVGRRHRRLHGDPRGPGTSCARRSRPTCSPTTACTSRAPTSTRACTLRG